ncbi:Holliday junction resolvase RuvX [Candidatus Saccharibacteria bacterium]|nr:Holliday junction resolvase RuvX [Candidatus Saccharibacteria bacterium]
MHPDNVKEFLGVDIGNARIGIARGSDVARLAEPLKTVPADIAFKELGNLIDSLKPAGVVVGLPRGLDGQETDQTRLVREWVKKAKTAIALPFYWQDEALTTHSAESLPGEAGIDAKAAAVILQDFLDSPETERVRC